MVRKEQVDINYNEKLFFKVVKLSFHGIYLVNVTINGQSKISKLIIR